MLLNTALMFEGCKKLPEGNLSTLIHYEFIPFQIEQGRVFLSRGVISERSNRPLTFKLIKVSYRETGEDITDIFLKKYQIKVWKALYNPQTDTTIALINAKRIDSMVFPISINPYSGQVQANYATINLPLGKYAFDLAIENSAGKGVYNDIGQFDLIAAPFFDVSVRTSIIAVKKGNENITKLITSEDDQIKVTRISENENKVILRFLDKNGALFNPKKGEVIKRAKSGLEEEYLTTLEDYSLLTTVYDDRIEYNYEILPFPLVDLSKLIFFDYRIPSNNIEFDSNLELPYNTYACNLRFKFQLFIPGTYQVDIIISQGMRIP